MLLQQRKQNKPRKVKSETLQAKNITHEVIKNSATRDQLMIVDEEGDASGASPS